MVPIPSPNRRNFAAAGTKKPLKGRELAYRVWRWVENHEDGFFQIYGYLKTMNLQGFKGRVRDRVAVFCVEHNIKVSDEDFTFSNTLWAGISRYMVLYDHSLYGSPIEFKQSDIDAYGLFPVSYLDLEPLEVNYGNET